MTYFNILQSIDLEVIAAETMQKWSENKVANWMHVNKTQQWYNAIINMHKKLLSELPHEQTETIMNTNPLWVQIVYVLFNSDGLSIPVYSGKDYETRLGELSLDSLINGCTKMSEVDASGWGRLVDGDGSVGDYETFIRLVITGSFLNPIK